MNQALPQAAAKPPLGYRRCPCGALNHYKKATCAVCGVANVVAAQDSPQGDTVVPLPTAAVVVEPYIVLADFKTQIGDVLGVFKAKMVLTDWKLIQDLLAAGNPIAPVSQSSGMTCCPKCQHVFPLMVATPGPKRAG